MEMPGIQWQTVDLKRFTTARVSNGLVPLQSSRHWDLPSLYLTIWEQIHPTKACMLSLNHNRRRRKRQLETHSNTIVWMDPQDPQDPQIPKKHGYQ